MIKMTYFEIKNGKSSANMTKEFPTRIKCSQFINRNKNIADYFVHETRDGRTVNITNQFKKVKQDESKD